MIVSILATVALVATAVLAFQTARLYRTLPARIPLGSNALPAHLGGPLAPRWLFWAPLVLVALIVGLALSGGPSMVRSRPVGGWLATIEIAIFAVFSVRRQAAVAAGRETSFAGPSWWVFLVLYVATVVLVTF